MMLQYQNLSVVHAQETAVTICAGPLIRVLIRVYLWGGRDTQEWQYARSTRRYSTLLGMDYQRDSQEAHIYVPEDSHLSSHNPTPSRGQRCNQQSQQV